MGEQSVEYLLKTLQVRFLANMHRHKEIEWADVQNALMENKAAQITLEQMEATGGEPDVVGRCETSGSFIFCDCSPESPKGRRSLCYDQAALASRKQHKPAGSVLAVASAMGAEVLNEQQYRELQQLDEFDLKTSSWVKTPASIRDLGGAIFCDRRYGQVFVYHNGAESYYAARGFRCRVLV